MARKTIAPLVFLFLVTLVSQLAVAQTQCGPPTAQWLLGGVRFW